MDRCCSPYSDPTPSVPRSSPLPGPEQITAAGPRAGRGTNPRGASRWSVGAKGPIPDQASQFQPSGVEAEGGRCLPVSGRRRCRSQGISTAGWRSREQTHTTLRRAGRQPCVVLFGQASVRGGLVIWTLEQRGLRQVSGTTTTTAQLVFDLMWFASGQSERFILKTSRNKAQKG